MISDENGTKKKFYFPELPKTFSVEGLKVDR